jgi:hypothetical protein
MRCKPPVEPGRRLNRRLDYARQLGTKLLVRHLPRAIRPGTEAQSDISVSYPTTVVRPKIAVDVPSRGSGGFILP